MTPIRKGVLVGLCGMAIAHPAAALAQRRATATTGPIEISGDSDSQCAITIGDPSVGNDGGRYSAVLALTIACNTPFTLHGAAARGMFQAASPGNAPGEFTPVPYEVLWPTSLLNSAGAPIAPQFRASGEEWQAGIIAVSGPTRDLQAASMIVRLRNTLPHGSWVIPDTFMIEIEQN